MFFIKDKNKNYEKVINKIDKLKGNSEIRFKDLFTKDFMVEYTNFKTINQMFEESDFEINDGEDFDNIPENELNNFINNNTDFSDWDEMIERAITEWVKKQI